MSTEHHSLNNEARLQWMREQNMPDFAVNVEITWREATRRARVIEQALQKTIHNDTVDLCELYQQVGDLTADNNHLRALLSRCNAFNALDCLEAKQADKEARAALEGKE